MRVLHSCARQLAATTAAVRSGGLLPSSTPEELLAPWGVWLLLLCGLTTPVEMLGALEVTGEVETATAAEGVAVCGELAAALRSSRVLEHLAQWLMALAARPACSNAIIRTVGDVMSGICRMLKSGCGSCLGLPSCALAATRTAVEDLAAALRPPCLQHLLAAGGVLALREADGGPVYGLDEQLYGRPYPPATVQTLFGHVRGADLWALLSARTGERHHTVRGFLPERPWCCVLLRVAAEVVGRCSSANAAGLYDQEAFIIAHNALVALAPHLGSAALRGEQAEEAWRLLLRLTDCVVGEYVRSGLSQGNEHDQLIASFCESVASATPPGERSRRCLRTGMCERC
jgi:hypothetical protein